MLNVEDTLVYTIAAEIAYQIVHLSKSTTRK